MRGWCVLLWGAALLLLPRANAEPTSSTTQLDDDARLEDAAPSKHPLMQMARVSGLRGVETGGGGGGVAASTRAAARDAGTCDVAAPPRLPAGQNPIAPSL
jgi:hypothetical protein